MARNTRKIVGKDAYGNDVYEGQVPVKDAHGNVVYREPWVGKGPGAENKQAEKPKESEE
jgi:hypothetical protein